MISFSGIEWATNEKREILAGLQLSKDIGEPIALIVNGDEGYVVFDGAGTLRVNIPQEILDLIIAAANILIVTLRGGTLIAEKRVPVSRI